MKLKEYILNLQKVVEDNPDANEFEVIYSIDDEGNSFNTVYSDPSLGSYEDREFTTEEYFDNEVPDDFEVNSVCIN